MARHRDDCKVNYGAILLETEPMATQQGCMEGEDRSTLDHEMNETYIINSKATAESYTVGNFSVDVYEPLRSVTDFRPPKRFYRTFWRSAARRIMELNRLHSIRKQQLATKVTAKQHFHLRLLE